MIISSITIVCSSTHVDLRSPFPHAAFEKGTMGIIDILADLTATGSITVIGGGDSVAACEKSGRAKEMSHISTGGGASLELMEGKILPGVAALDDK